MEGELTVGGIRKIHEELLHSLEKVRHLDIDIAGAVDMDLSFLQLLCSAHRTAAQTGKTVALTGDIPNIFRQAVEDNGYGGTGGCSGEAGRTCLWISEKKD
jgi:anti-anti-sigma regulatory factor